MPNRRAWVYLNCTLRIIEAKENQPPESSGSNHGRTGTGDCSRSYATPVPVSTCAPAAITEAIFATSKLVPEVSYAGKNHRHGVAIGGIDDFLVSYRASGLYDRR